MTTRSRPDVEGSAGMKVAIAKPWLGEEEALLAAEVVRSGWLIMGPKVEALEDRLSSMVGAKHGIAVNSGSSALLVAMGALGIGKGDEVICPNMTFISTASAALFLGATPVFVDLEMDYYGMDPAALEAKITPRTKAIVPVHYAGHSAEMGRIMEVANRHGIPVLEDAAESHLARFNGEAFTGAIGKIGIFSFTPSKPMTTGEGGMIVTNDDDLAEKCRLFKNFGDTGKFEWSTLGFNFRMPEVMGAIGLIQLDRLEEAIRLRREKGRRYTAAFAANPRIITPKERHPEDHNYQLYTLRIPDDGHGPNRDQLKARLAEVGVGSRLYYPSLHNQGIFADLDTGTDADYPNAVEYRNTALSLPLFPGLSLEEQEYVIESVLNALES